jgi:hypothetical protein
VSGPHLKVGMSGYFWSTRSSGARRPSGVPGRRVPWSALVPLVGLLLLTGCRLQLTAESVIDPDGSATVAVTAGFDESLLEELDALGIDPTAELEAAAASTEGWEAVRVLRDDGGLEVVASRAVDDVAAIGEAFRELVSGLAETDPALLIDVEVTTDANGGTEVLGSASLRPPASAGLRLDDVEVGPDASELAALVATSVDAQLRIGFPGPVTDHDGARIEGRTVIWDLPADEVVGVRAAAAAPGWWVRLAGWATGPPAMLVVGAAILAALVGGAVRSGRRSLTDPEET